MSQPVKPYEDFPFTPHLKGWVRKHNKKVRFVCNGKLPVEEVFAEWERKKPIWDAEDAKATGEPNVVSATSTTSVMDVATLCDLFMTSKQAQVSEGMGTLTCEEYDEAVRDFAAVVGPDKLVEDLVPADFQQHRLFLGKEVKISDERTKKAFGVHRRKKYMILVRSMFKWGNENDHIPKLPKYGTEYKLPSKAEMRKSENKRRLENGELAYTPEEIGALLAVCDNVNVRGAMMMALNFGFGQEDVSSLSEQTVGMGVGIIDSFREKTGVRRRGFIWPEAETAISEVLAARPRPARPDFAHLVFLTRFGNPYIVDVKAERADGQVRTNHKDALATRFYHLNLRAGVSKRGRNFYSLRRTFRTSADETGDQRAIALVMGHEVGDVADYYVEKISNERLRKVTDHVRKHVLLPALKAESRIRRKQAMKENNANMRLLKAG